MVRRRIGCLFRSPLRRLTPALPEIFIGERKMRTAEEIAKDIVSVRSWLSDFGYINVAGKSLEELAELEARRMAAERRLFALEQERRDFVRRPLTP
jgi:hypothetical protein